MGKLHVCFNSAELGSRSFPSEKKERLHTLKLLHAVLCPYLKIQPDCWGNCLNASLYMQIERDWGGGDKQGSMQDAYNVLIKGKQGWGGGGNKLPKDNNIQKCSARESNLI